MKYKQWLNIWLDLYVKSTVKERTFERYNQITQKQLIPLLGEYELSELSAVVLQKFVAQLSMVKGLSANTVNCIITVMQNSLKTAVIVGAVDKQYAGNIQRPKPAEKEVTCFSLEEQKKIEKYIAESNKPKLQGIAFGFYTGLRLGELLALKWTDIDFDKGLLYVNKSCHDKYINGKCVKIIETPKTTHSRRVIPIPKQLMPMLKSLHKQSHSVYVVAENENGIGNRSYQRSFELLLKKLNIPHKGFHSIRHTFATRAIECGMDVKTLSEILGHKNPTVTLTRYAHSLLEHKTEMMNKLGKLF